MSDNARDILDALWYDMHDDRRLAVQVRTAICNWGNCEDALMEPNGEVWVSNSPHLITDSEADSLVAFLQRECLVDESV